LLRVLGMVIGIFCTATVLTVSFVLAYAWSQGNLTPESSQEIVAVLKGEPRPSDYQTAEQDNEMSSYEQLIKLRTERILGISARESELAILKQAIDDQTNFVLKERKQLEILKKTFRQELAEQEEKVTSEAVTQARGILLKMEPESAVEKLLGLDVPDAVVLVKGMPEKEAARILDQFRQRIVGQDPEGRVEKAEEIYRAIYRGEPYLPSVTRAQQALMTPTAATDIKR